MRRERAAMELSSSTRRGSAGQRGLSMIGFLFVSAVVLVVALLAFRMFTGLREAVRQMKALMREAAHR